MAKNRVVVVSDLHVGSVVGLWAEGQPLEGGGTYTANKFQQWLLECWWRTVDDIQRMRPRPVVVLNGDAIQGVNKKDGQLVTPNKSIQVGAAYALLEPVAAAAKKFYQIRGTEWHEGKAAEDVEALAERLGAVPNPATGQHTWWELYHDLGKPDDPDEEPPVVHFAHHVGASSVAWYEATVPLRDLLLFLAELWRFFGKAAPNVKLAARSHRHRYIHVDLPPNLHAVVTPGFQLKTAFSYKRASAMLPIVGYVVLEYDGREILVKRRIFPLPVEYVHVEEFP
jgi:hypothetical protein